MLNTYFAVDSFKRQSRDSFLPFGKHGAKLDQYLNHILTGMGLFTSASQRHAQQLTEQGFYEQALKEISDSQPNMGVYAQALSLADGDTTKANALYLKLRAKSLYTEAQAIQEMIALREAQARVPPTRGQAKKPVSPPAGHPKTPLKPLYRSEGSPLGNKLAVILGLLLLIPFVIGLLEALTNMMRR